MSEALIIAEPRSKKARDRIFETATELFYRDGIRAVGVEEIVNRAGATKPSLYRSFESKDALVAAYLRERGDHFWGLFDEAADAHPGEPRAQLLAFFKGVAKRAAQPGYRGCGLTNAVVEYPDPRHPGKQVALAHKAALRERLRGMTAALGARKADDLADSLLMLLEGAYVSSQMFEPEANPATRVHKAAKALIDAYT